MTKVELPICLFLRSTLYLTCKSFGQVMRPWSNGSLCYLTRSRAARSFGRLCTSSPSWLALFPTISNAQPRWLRNTCKRLSKPLELNRRLSTFRELPEDTIYALSTAPGRSAIAIIRISGSACLDVRRIASSLETLA